MSLWALIPAKDPSLGKTRLSTRVTPAARRLLSRFSFERVLRAVLDMPDIEGCLVVSGSAEQLDTAARLGATPLWEPPLAESRRQAPWFDTSLNDVIARGAHEAVSRGATSLLVVAGDVPTATPAALTNLVRSLKADRGVAIAPDRHRNGTNALLARPPLVIPFAFGEGSFERHRAYAEERGVAFVTCRSADLALDIDTPEDLDLLAARAGMPSLDMSAMDGDVASLKAMLDSLGSDASRTCVSGHCR